MTKVSLLADLLQLGLAELPWCSLRSSSLGLRDSQRRFCTDGLLLVPCLGDGDGCSGLEQSASSISQQK